MNTEHFIHSFVHSFSAFRLVSSPQNLYFEICSDRQPCWSSHCYCFWLHFQQLGQRERERFPSCCWMCTARFNKTSSLRFTVCLCIATVSCLTKVSLFDNLSVYIMFITTCICFEFFVYVYAWLSDFSDLFMHYCFMSRVNPALKVSVLSARL